MRLWARWLEAPKPVGQMGSLDRFFVKETER